MADPYYRYHVPSGSGSSGPRSRYPGYLPSVASPLPTHEMLGSNDPMGRPSDMIRRDYQMNPLRHGAYGVDDISGVSVNSDRGPGGLATGASSMAYSYPYPYGSYPLHPGSHGLNGISGSQLHSGHVAGGLELGATLNAHPLQSGALNLDDMQGARVHSEAGYVGSAAGASLKAYPLQPEAHVVDGMSGSQGYPEAAFSGLASRANTEYPLQPGNRGPDDISGSQVHSEAGFSGLTSRSITQEYPLQHGTRGQDDLLGSRVHSNLSAAGLGSGTGSKAHPLQSETRGPDEISGYQVHSESGFSELASRASMKDFPMQHTDVSAGGLASGATLKAQPLQPGTHGPNDISGSQVRSEADIGGSASGASIKRNPSQEDPISISQKRDVTVGNSVKVSGESNVLFVDGLPTDCTRREVGHLFRPFIGFKEIRVVHKEPRRSGDRAMVLCFVEFSDTKCALTALEALQGYKFDDKKPDSPALKIHFAHFPFRLPSDTTDQQNGIHH